MTAAAAGAGHLDVLLFAVSAGCPWDVEESVTRAREGGWEDVVEWALAQQQPRAHASVVDGAAAVALA